MVICPDERLNRALLTTAVSEICRRAGSPYASARNSEGSSVFLPPGSRRARDERPRRLSTSPPTPCTTRSPSDIRVPSRHGRGLPCSILPPVSTTHPSARSGHMRDARRAPSTGPVLWLLDFAFRGCTVPTAL